MRFVSRCAANRWVFNADLKLSTLSEESPETSSRPLQLQRRMTDVRTCCDGVVARAADADWLTAGADDWSRRIFCDFLLTGNVRRVGGKKACALLEPVGVVGRVVGRGVVLAGALIVDDDLPGSGHCTNPSTDWKRQTYARSSPPSTREHDSGGTNILWLRAYTEHVDRCPTNVAQSEADHISRGQTSACQWWLVLQHSAHAKACR